MNNQREKIGVYPGSFDPVTLGHLDIIERSARMFDKLIVAVLDNRSKKALFTADERVKIIQNETKHICNVEVMQFDGLSVDFAKAQGSRTLVRGLRAVTDFEYELQMAQTNHAMSTEIDTIFLTTDLKYAYLSSSIVKEVASFGGDISQFVTPAVRALLEAKYAIKED